MSKLAERARAIAEAARAKPVDEKRLGAVLDRSIAREWYLVTFPEGYSRECYFNPPQTVPEVLARFFPSCGVVPL
jgi:hypothetical protein